MNRQSSGFTLIELVISLAVIAILATIAYPSYVDSIRRARRADAINALESLHLSQELFRANCTSYATSLGGSNLCDGTTPPTYRINVAAQSADGHYAISILSGASGTAFVATADPAGTDQALDSCGVFAINQDGPITNDTDYANGRCWGL
jgi:type IV pilus assembly protein PilE